MNVADLAATIAAGSADTPHADSVLALPLAEVLALAEALDEQRRRASDRFVRVRCAAWLVALYRFRLQDEAQLSPGAPIPVAAWQQRLQRRYREAVDSLQVVIAEQGLGQALASELAQVFHGLQYAELAELVRCAVREQRGNRWMFRCGSLLEYPLALRPALLDVEDGGQYPLLEERTAVRLDFTHSGWSDIFFLAMQAPTAAAVVNWSVDIAEDDGPPQPPIRTCLRVIDEPVLRLTAVDLGETVDLHDLSAVFDFSRDHLGLLKAAVVASGLVPAALEGTDQSLAHLLHILCGPSRGLELVSQVARIPKGSRLAVSTNLLGSLIAVCMRASGQTAAISGPLNEDERRVVASRAILGEWLGGSGGGWQDSGGLWPGLKIMRGAALTAGPQALAPGALLPDYETLTLSPAAQQALEGGLVVFHGGMSGNVGPVLELVTSRFLLHWRAAAAARAQLLETFPEIITALRNGNLPRLGSLTQGLFQGPLRRIIPGVSNAYVDDLIATASEHYGAAFYGFMMLGGMAGGGMAMVVDPSHRAAVDASWPQLLAAVAARHRAGLPFVVDPRVLRVAGNSTGSTATVHRGHDAVLSPAYYEVHAPLMAALRERDLNPRRREDLLCFLAASGDRGHGRLLEGVVRNLLPQPSLVAQAATVVPGMSDGVDAAYQQSLQRSYRAGDMSLQRNRLPERSEIRDIDGADLCRQGGEASSAGDGIAVVTLAGGLGSRWSGGAGVVKALAPIAELGGQWRSFLDIHLAKFQRQRHEQAIALPHVITTSFLTHQPIAAAVAAHDPQGQHCVLSRGALLNQRVIPTAFDLHHYFRERPRPRLDAQAQKAREDGERALMAWAKEVGAGQPYVGSGIADQCNPPGHWWEIPSMLLNGTLHRLLQQHPALHTLLVHNIDTLGVTVDGAIAATFAASHGVLGVEVIPRLAADSGGALARVDGRPRLVESLAMPDEALELGLRWYNSNTWWLRIDGLLAWFGLSRNDLGDHERVRAQVLHRSRRLPTYVTIKDVRRSWGNGHADIVPVAQFEQLWGDMSAQDDCPTVYIPVPRARGQQLKDIGQVPDWIMDGSAAAISALL